MRVLYFEPAIYFPYKLNLRKKDAVILDKIVIDGGVTITPDRQDYRVIRPFKNDYLFVSFNTPNYMELGELEGSLGAITVYYHFTIEGVSFIHKQNIQFSGDAGNPPYFCLRDGRIYGDPQYSTFDGVSATMGLVGLDMLKSAYNFTKNKVKVKEQLMSIENEPGHVIIEYGLHPERSGVFVMESYSHINPSSALKHGTLN